MTHSVRIRDRIKRILILLLAAALLPCALPGAAEEERAPLPWPEDGVMYSAFEGIEDGAVLHVRFKATDGLDGYAAQVCLYTQDREQVLSLFVRGGGEVTVRVPGGAYIERHCVGTDWYGPEEAFGDGGWSDRDSPNCAGLDRSDQVLTFQDGMEYVLTVEIKTGYEPPWEEWRDF